MPILAPVNNRFERHVNLDGITLSRFTQRLIIRNIRLFFRTERVTRHGSDDTSLSPTGLLVVAFGLRVPVGLAPKLWYDVSHPVWNTVALYLLVGSIGERVRVHGT